MPSPSKAKRKTPPFHCTLREDPNPTQYGQETLSTSKLRDWGSWTPGGSWFSKFSRKEPCQRQPIPTDIILEFPTRECLKTNVYNFIKYTIDLYNAEHTEIIEDTGFLERLKPVAACATRGLRSSIVWQFSNTVTSSSPVKHIETYWNHLSSVRLQWVFIYVFAFASKTVTQVRFTQSSKLELSRIPESKCLAYGHIGFVSVEAIQCSLDAYWFSLFFSLAAEIATMLGSWVELCGKRGDTNEFIERMELMEFMELIVVRPAAWHKRHEEKERIRSWCTRARNCFGIFFGGFFLVALGLSRLVSGKTSGKMQVSFGSDVQNCCKRLISTFVSVFSVFYNISVLSLFRSMCVCV